LGDSYSINEWETKTTTTTTTTTTVVNMHRKDNEII
jgi:hypothetical protein